MFDFGFSELMVIGVVLLIVVGPERLPKVARTAGHLLGRVQRYVSDVKSDIQREMQLEELKKLQEQVKQQAHELESSVRSGAASIESEVGRTTAEIRAGLPDAAASSAGAAAGGSTPAAELLSGSTDGAPAAGPQREPGPDVPSKPAATTDKV